MDDTALALTCFFPQLVVGILVFFRAWRCIGPVHSMLIRRAHKKKEAWATVQLDKPTERLTAADDRLQPVLAKTMNDLAQLDAYRKTLVTGSAFLSHTRNEANFIMDNSSGGLAIPPACPLERAGLIYSPMSLTAIVVLRNAGSRNMMVNALGFGLMMSSFVSLVWLAEMKGSDSVDAIIVSMLRSRIRLARSGFNFLVAFLIIGLLNFVVARWRDYLVTCQTVQAKLRDLGVAIGAAVTNGADAATRVRLFQIYRYLNVVHCMTYAGSDDQLPQTADGYGMLGLLTPAEAKCLEPLGTCSSKAMGDSQRETLLGWVGGILGAMVREGKLHGPFSPPSQGMVNGLRSACAGYDDLSVRHMPNLWIACTHTLMVFVFTLVDLEIVLDLSASDLEKEPRWMLLVATCFALLAILIVNYVYMLAWAMIQEFSSPFGGDSDDDYSPHALLGSTERSLFASLRSSFDRAVIEEGLSAKSEGVTARS